MKTVQTGMRQKVLDAHRDAIRYTHAPAVPATTVRRFMPGLKRQSHVTRILNDLVRSGMLAKSGYQERGRFITTYCMLGKSGAVE
ncbi:hypothetical protein Geu3261_0025_020 [Komagataeibacter europaeus NBRC 3261]|uniref:Transcriptional regulator n=1 Tax=Komagataeibacter europaeus NBRC 3261 TaxID=1234669 RepID=A0A0D6PWA9_KOMEU|nr:hypothetical protein [Komagataeibacter europaeus]GAN95464.1 hypothetical protein Geu3261_0025_020 [Komagataeibacter europaeus NBRC 3261]